MKTLIAISAIVTIGVRSVGMLSLIGNRAWEGYPPERADLPQNHAHAPLAPAGRGAGADDERVAAGAQRAHPVQHDADRVGGGARDRAGERPPAAHQDDAHRRAAAAEDAARHAVSALGAGDAHGAPGA